MGSYRELPLWRPPLLTQVPNTRGWWRNYQREAEVAAHQWLDLPNDVAVLMLDRAANALFIGMLVLQQTQGFNRCIVPDRTFRAALDAAQRVFEDARVEPDDDGRFLSRWYDICDTLLRTVLVPTTLGGSAPLWGPGLEEHEGAVIYDCAHTAYPGMFKELPLTTDTVLAVMSLFPTKPLGAVGGGLLVGSHDNIRRARAFTDPASDTKPIFFNYPTVAQAQALIERTQEPYNRVSWASLRTWCAEIAHIAETQYNLSPVRPVENLVTPHLLVFTGTEQDVERMRHNCSARSIETGRHYPSLGAGDTRPFISVPCWTDEVCQRLRYWPGIETVVQRPGVAAHAAN